MTELRHADTFAIILLAFRSLRSDSWFMTLIVFTLFLELFFRINHYNMNFANTMNGSLNYHTCWFLFFSRLMNTSSGWVSDDHQMKKKRNSHVFRVSLRGSMNMMYTSMTSRTRIDRQILRGDVVLLGISQNKITIRSGPRRTVDESRMTSDMTNHHDGKYQIESHINCKLSRSHSIHDHDEEEALIFSRWSLRRYVFSKNDGIVAWNLSLNVLSIFHEKEDNQ